MGARQPAFLQSEPLMPNKIVSRAALHSQALAQAALVWHSVASTTAAPAKAQACAGRAGVDQLA